MSSIAKHLIKFKGIDYAINNILDSTIYLNNPFNFNDPLDSYLIQLFGKKDKNQTLDIKEYIQIGDSKGIFCATNIDNLTNVLLWSHYADSHKGVALKYKVPKNLVGKLNEVSYDYPSHESFMAAIGYGNPSVAVSVNYETKNMLVDKSIFLKDKDWEYEHEIRYVRDLDDNKIRIESGWEVEAVYIGTQYLMNTSEKLKELIKLIKVCYSKRIKVYRMLYKYNPTQKRMELKPSTWYSDDAMLEYENWAKSIRPIEDELFERFKSSHNGELVERYIREILRRRL